MTNPEGSAIAAANLPHRGLTIAQKLVFAFLGFVLLFGLFLVLVYQRYVPPMVNQQIELRVESVTKAFASATFKPMVERNFVQVNKVAEAIAQLPDVAYAAAVNDRGSIAAGIFGKMTDFQPAFTDSVQKDGFPTEIVQKTSLATGKEAARTIINVGGQEVMDYAVRIPQTDSVVHVGLFIAGAQAAVRATLMPLLILLLALALAGAATLLVVARTVSRPIKQLSRQAEAISLLSA